MKYETLRRVKRGVGEVPKVGEAHKTGEACSRCGCPLTKGNRSFDSRLCKACFDADMAKLEAEDILEDSLTDSERFAEFLG